MRCGVIVDVEASRAIRQAEVGTARIMLERAEERFNLEPQRLADPASDNDERIDVLRSDFLLSGAVSLW